MHISALNHHVLLQCLIFGSLDPGSTFLSPQIALNGSPGEFDGYVVVSYRMLSQMHITHAGESNFKGITAGPGFHAMSFLSFA